MPALQAPRRAGRLRRLQHLGIGVLAVIAAWCCFGPFGLAPAVAWVWLTRPSPVPCGARWHIALADVRQVRLGPWRARILYRRGPAVDVFADEMDGADFARLRRTLKARTR